MCIYRVLYLLALRHFYSLRLVITRRLGNSTIRLRLLLRMSPYIWILTSNRGLMTLLHGCIPFLTTLSTHNRWWGAIALKTLIVGNNWRRRVIMVSMCGVVLVVCWNVYCFIGLDIGGRGDDVECVDHRWYLEYQYQLLLVRGMSSLPR